MRQRPATGNKIKAPPPVGRLCRARPEWLHSYKRRWLVPDLTAGVTLSAVAIPEVMGYASIAQTPIVTGLYTVIVPTAFFALIGSSRLLVVGADRPLRRHGCGFWPA